MDEETSKMFLKLFDAIRAGFQAQDEKIKTIENQVTQNLEITKKNENSINELIKIIRGLPA